ncbi:MAG: metal ABC transporter substrate-binding protein [Streptococcaceae bacterium]|nr:metal ABC transporter substrate-binding protein [Streptococcaceae bacterium]
MNRRKKWIIITFILLFIIFGCKNKSLNRQETTDVKVVTTFYPMYDFTKNIMGSSKNIKLLTPASVEPHDFEPSAKDIADITSADAFIYNSDCFETWVSKIKKNIDFKQTEVINAAKGIKLMAGPLKLEEANKKRSHQKVFDPHIWLSPKLAMKEVTNIKDGLIKKFPSKKDLFCKNAQEYLKKLEKLDNDYQTAFKNAIHKKFVTQHDAFSYLARDYDLKQVAIAGFSSEEEISPARLAKLKKYMKRKDIKVVYFEERTSAKIAQILAKEVGAETLVLSTLEGLTKTEQKEGKNYLSVMENNLKALKLTIK